MKVSELIAALSHYDPNLDVVNAAWDSYDLNDLAHVGSTLVFDRAPHKPAQEPLDDRPSPLEMRADPSDSNALPAGASAQDIRRLAMSLPPLRLDLHPRYHEVHTPCDPTETTFWEALRILRKAVQARGYNNRPLEFADCTFVGSTFWEQRADALQQEFFDLQVQLVNPILLKTDAAWALVSGLDSYISLCTL